jgi:amino acid permease
VLFLVCALLVAVSVSDLGIILALIGASGSTAVSYILPGFFYYFSFGEHEGPAWKRNLALLQGLTGLTIVPLCLAVIILF